MKVLHLPYNVASQVSASVAGLRAIGVNARGLIVPSASDVVQSHDGVEVLPPPPALPRSPRWARQHLSRHAQLMRAIAWADVLHWHFGYLVLPNDFDLRWATWLHKPGIAEFWGDDIRISAIEAKDNPVFARFAPEEYQARLTEEASLRTQRRFAQAGFSCMVPDATMRSYVRSELFPSVHIVRQRLVLQQYTPKPVNADSPRPLIVHSPSDKRLKGSEFVQAAIERLREKHPFEFRLIHGVPRHEALEILGQADLFIDQLFHGVHGLATLEAMALGKPVICNIKPSMRSWYPPDLPVVSATPEDIEAVLGGLLQDGQRRRALGIAGREYVERHHDASRLAHELKEIYLEELKRR